MMTKKTALEGVVCVGQLDGSHDIERNLVEIKKMSAAASKNGAALIVFPEAVMYAFTESGEKIAEIAQAHGDAFEASLQDIAKQYGIAILAGIYAPSPSGRASNVLTLVRPEGGAPLRYYKLHLYDAWNFKESDKHDVIALGPNYEELVVFELGGIRYGVLNCYDLRFPEMSRLLLEKGADVLVVASGWVSGPLKELHWETLLRARAIENTCYVIASCQPAPWSVGLSMIVDPMGAVVAGVHESQGLATHTLSMQRQENVRASVPCVSQRRYLSMRPTSGQ